MTSSLELKTEYWSDSQARRAFKDFMIEIHGLDFSAWESAGFWDAAYTPFSFFQGGAVVASVCLYRLNAVVNGRFTQLAQISGVGTLPDFRRRGLNRELTEIALKWAEGMQEGIFLFADAEATPFYKACGFMEQDIFLEVTDAPAFTHKDGAIKLDCSTQETLDRVYHYAESRAPLSDRLSVLNERLVLFHVQYGLGDCAYEIPALNCIVFFERDAGRLKIYDILGDTIPPLSKLYPFISSEEDRIIEFHFHADKLGLDQSNLDLIPGSGCFVKGGFPIRQPVFPFTAYA